MPPHPVAVATFLQDIGNRPVDKHVHEEFALRLQPAGHLFKEQAPVANALEHFNRDHAIKTRINVEAVNVGRDDRDVVQVVSRNLGEDVLPLRNGIRHRGNFRSRHESHGQALAPVLRPRVRRLSLSITANAEWLWIDSKFSAETLYRLTLSSEFSRAATSRTRSSTNFGLS